MQNSYCSQIRQEKCVYTLLKSIAISQLQQLSSFNALTMFTKQKS